MRISVIDNKKDWDRFILEVGPNAFFQSWDWGEVEKKNGYTVDRYGLYDGEKLLGVAQSIEVRAKRGKYLHIRHGPILRQWKKKYLDKFVGYLKNQAQERSLDFIRFSPLIKASKGELIQEIGFRKAPIHNMDAEVSFVISLDKSIEDILKDMRKTTRNLIRKATKIELLKVKSGLDKKKIYDFLYLFKETADKKKFIFQRGIENELDVFSQDNQAEIIISYYKDEPVAGAFIVYSGNQGIYRYGASSDLGKKVPASYLIQFEAIRKTKERKLDFYNLWGGVAEMRDKSHPWYGITVFKRGFGGEIRKYLHAQDLPLSYIYWKTYFLEVAIKYIRGYERIGGFRFPPFIRRLFGV